MISDQIEPLSLIGYNEKCLKLAKEKIDKQNSFKMMIVVAEISMLK